MKHDENNGAIKRNMQKKNIKGNGIIRQYYIGKTSN